VMVQAEVQEGRTHTYRPAGILGAGGNGEGLYAGSDDTNMASARVWRDGLLIRRFARLRNMC
jgi:hypothetical protein